MNIFLIKLKRNFSKQIYCIFKVVNIISILGNRRKNKLNLAFERKIPEKKILGALINFFFFELIHQGLFSLKNKHTRLFLFHMGTGLYLLPPLLLCQRFFQSQSCLTISKAKIFYRKMGFWYFDFSLGKK